MSARYQTQPYLKSHDSKITAAFELDDGRFCIALQDSIFYPQGGGQKGDRGRLHVGEVTYAVIDTIKDALSLDERSLCILEEPAPQLAEGQEVLMEIDWAHRYEQMQLHSTVHLHHCEMEQIIGHKLPVPITSDIGTDQTAYNRYETAEVTEELAQQAFQKMNELIVRGAPIETRDDPSNRGHRYWECLGFTIPCGGTHLRDIREIGSFEMTFSKKKGKPKVSFHLVRPSFAAMEVCRDNQ